MKDEGYIAVDKRNDFVLVHSFEQARIKGLEYFNPMTLVKIYVGRDLKKSSFSYMKLVLRLTHSTHYGRWTEAMTRPMQRAHQSTSRDLRTRRGTGREVFEWRLVEHMTQDVLLKAWDDLDLGECFPCFNLEM